MGAREGGKEGVVEVIQAIGMVASEGGREGGRFFVVRCACVLYPDDCAPVLCVIMCMAWTCTGARVQMG